MQYLQSMLVLFTYDFTQTCYQYANMYSTLFTPYSTNMHTSIPIHRECTYHPQTCVLLYQHTHKHGHCCIHTPTTIGTPIPTHTNTLIPTHLQTWILIYPHTHKHRECYIHKSIPLLYLLYLHTHKHGHLYLHTHNHWHFYTYTPTNMGTLIPTHPQTWAFLYLHTHNHGHFYIKIPTNMDTAVSNHSQTWTPYLHTHILTWTLFYLRNHNYGHSYTYTPTNMDTTVSTYPQTLPLLPTYKLKHGHSYTCTPTHVDTCIRTPLQTWIFYVHTNKCGHSNTTHMHNMWHLQTCKYSHYKLVNTVTIHCRSDVIIIRVFSV